MKIIVHYTVYGEEDSFVIEGDDLTDLQEEVKEEINSRGLDLEKNNIWTENSYDKEE